MIGAPLAAHSAVTAIPFFLPTIVVVAVIVVVVWRDRHRHPAEGAESEKGTPPPEP
ncbi:MAG: hypothetical protein JWO67_4922 [Streptosporangiaceae bacterium]|nr:hypothetical protein [Streptosporangiaceae bacterium]